MSKCNYYYSYGTHCQQIDGVNHIPPDSAKQFCDKNCSQPCNSTTGCPRPTPPRPTPSRPTPPRPTPPSPPQSYNCKYYRVSPTHCQQIDGNHIPTDSTKQFCDKDCSQPCNSTTVCPKPTPPSPTPPSPTPPSPGGVKTCNSNNDCLAQHGQYCRKGICVSAPIPDNSGTLASITQATVRPTENELKTYATNIHAGHSTQNGKDYIPAFPNKKPSLSGRDWRMTLWHEGFKNVPANKLKEYVEQFTDFIKDKKFDRAFLQSGDPYLTDNYGVQKFPYTDIDFVIDNYLGNIQNIDGFEAGLLAIVDPRYTSYYDITTPGGIWGNNPTYKNQPVKGDVQGINYCQSPYRECSKSSDMCAANALSQQKCGDCPKEKPYCVAGNCQKDPVCGEITDYCKGSRCCLQYPPGCPNNIEQFFKYVGDLNNKAKQKGYKTVITTIALDGEDLGMYGTDKYGLVQLWQAARKYAPDVLEIGYAHGPSVNAVDNWTNAAYPELYWIGELKPAIGCSGCKDGASKSDAGCKECLKSIYQENKNQPQQMLDAFSKYLDTTQFKTVPKDQRKGVCPLFSLESAHLKNDNVPGNNSTQESCIAKYYNDDPNSNFCGTFDGFGDWEWDKFEDFMDRFAKKYGVEEIGVYEWQFVPFSWTKSLPSNEVHTPYKDKNNLLWLWILLGILLLVVIGVIIVKFSKK